MPSISCCAATPKGQTTSGSAPNWSGSAKVRCLTISGFLIVIHCQSFYLFATLFNSSTFYGAASTVHRSQYPGLYGSLPPTLLVLCLEGRYQYPGSYRACYTTYGAALMYAGCSQSSFHPPFVSWKSESFFRCSSGCGTVPYRKVLMVLSCKPCTTQVVAVVVIVN